MPHYKLFHFRHSELIGVDGFDAGNDAMAMHDAKPLDRHATSELWETDRKIITMKERD